MWQKQCYEFEGQAIKGYSFLVAPFSPIAHSGGSQSSRLQGSAVEKPLGGKCLPPKQGQLARRVREPLWKGDPSDD